MYKSLCILEGNLYLCRASLPSLIQYLKNIYGEYKVNEADKARILFKGNIRDNSYYGTFEIIGDKGCITALEYLRFLKDNNPDVSLKFVNCCRDTPPNKINNVVHLLIQKDMYETIDINKEVLYEIS